jgi:phosphotransferase system enzyme I (PtsI)
VLKDTMEDLDEEGVAFNRYIRIGMMIEVPSTAMMPKPYVRDSDFVSIGSNDLIQYTLAVDRGNQRVASLFTGAHPAVIRLIRRVQRAGRAELKNVSLCGEMGGDPDYTMLLIGLGLRTLSITPNNIPEIKQLIRQITLKQAERIAKKAVKLEHGHQVLNLLHDEMRRYHPDFYRADVSKLAHHSKEA